MRKYFFVLFCISSILIAQTVPDLPTATSSATAEVVNDTLYFLGGSNGWAGSIRYPFVYKYDGNNWNLYDTIPDNNVWGSESVVAGNELYLIGGWPSGARNVRKYDILNKTWTYLNLSPNTAPYGFTVEFVNNHIYLMGRNGPVFEYNLSSDTWLTKTPNNFSSYALSSVVYQDEIYLAGFYDSTFFKYNPANDQWIQLANFPFQLSKCAMQVIGDKIYCAGGSAQGSPADQYRSLVTYDINSNTWQVDQFQLTAERVWMADVVFDNKFFVLGGFDTTAAAVNIVEEITPIGAIPVQLVSFIAETRGNEVELKWTTATETNNRGFEIERNGKSNVSELIPSGKGQTWNRIGFVEGYGTTSESNSYSYSDKDLQPGVYSYRLKQLDYDGTFEYSNEIEVVLNVPDKFALHQNYPNPFNPKTKIKFTIPNVETRHASSLLVTLKIYNILGKEVATLVNEEKPAGVYEIEFNGSSLSSGVYFYSLRAGDFNQTKKLLLLK